MKKLEEKLAKIEEKEVKAMKETKKAKKAGQINKKATKTTKKGEKVMKKSTKVVKKATNATKTIKKEVKAMEKAGFVEAVAALQRVAKKTKGHSLRGERQIVNDLTGEVVACVREKAKVTMPISALPKSWHEGLRKCEGNHHMTWIPFDHPHLEEIFKKRVATKKTGRMFEEEVYGGPSPARARALAKSKSGKEALNSIQARIKALKEKEKALKASLKAQKAKPKAKAKSKAKATA